MEIDTVPSGIYYSWRYRFSLFGEYNRTREKWQLDDKFFEIATKAVSDERSKRQQSIRQLAKEWKRLRKPKRSRKICR